ncbi:MAG: hypothetical protein H6Q16_327 [Bacteroidetes bacterium]|nr:hypothetical protein [Bacteroidota bacterium]
MPFTFSHPSILIPLFYLPKKWISVTGLVIGSMIPDFEYFLRMQIKSKYSHSIYGVFWFDLTLSILLAFIFHNIVKNQLIDNLPKSLYLRLASFKNFDWNKYFRKNWYIVIISILIGIFSHIFWDSFTHYNGYFVQRNPSLVNSLTIFQLDIPIFKIIQHASTILGGILIIYLGIKLPKKSVEYKKPNINYWLVFTLISLLIISIRIIFGLNPKQYGNLIVTAISSGLISLIITPLIIRKNKNINHQINI